MLVGIVSVGGLLTAFGTFTLAALKVFGDKPPAAFDPLFSASLRTILVSAPMGVIVGLAAVCRRQRRSSRLAYVGLIGSGIVAAILAIVYRALPFYGVGPL